MDKTPAVAYMSRKIRTTSRSEMNLFIADSPLKARDKSFMQDVLDGLSFKEMQIKYAKSISRIAQWKRCCFEQLQKYEYESLRK